MKPNPFSSAIAAFTRHAPAFLGAALLAPCFPAARAQPANGELGELAEQNRTLRLMLAEQQKQIDQLRGEMSRLAKASEETGEAVQALEQKGGNRSSEHEGRKIAISGVGSLSYFSAQRNGKYTNDEFILDDARVFLEAPIRKNTYVFGELILASREASDENFHLGEFYVDFENALGEHAPDRVFNVRAGRLNIPFGEEYQQRHPIDNALITHSVTDFWGIDEGVEVYGEWEKLSYVFAVQNGGISRLRDWNSDKSLTARLGYTPIASLHLSASAMTTGRLDVANEFGSEMWIGNGVFRPMSASQTATTFEADLVQFDAKWTFHHGWLSGAAGKGRFRDNDSLVSADQDFKFYQLEGVHTLFGKLYGAARVSGLSFDRGYYVAGLGDFGRYFMGSALTRRLERMNLAAGYRFSSDLNLKVEYTWEEGRLLDDTKRTDSDQIAAQLALRF